MNARSDPDASGNAGAQTKVLKPVRGLFDNPNHASIRDRADTGACSQKKPVLSRNQRPKDSIGVYHDSDSDSEPAPKPPRKRLFRKALGEIDAQDRQSQPLSGSSDRTSPRVCDPYEYPADVPEKGSFEQTSKKRRRNIRPNRSFGAGKHTLSKSARDDSPPCSSSDSASRVEPPSNIIKTEDENHAFDKLYSRPNNEKEYLENVEKTEEEGDEEEEEEEDAKTEALQPAEADEQSNGSTSEDDLVKSYPPAPPTMSPEPMVDSSGRRLSRGWVWMKRVETPLPYTMEQDELTM
ncbi:hypothetical protein HK104_005675 [Borealophlyctis nickersoniae]|nr:hypothetical protein HK104_005675 [Borealophlyctis nickersoniae]